MWSEIARVRYRKFFPEHLSYLFWLILKISSILFTLVLPSFFGIAMESGTRNTRVDPGLVDIVALQLLKHFNQYGVWVCLIFLYGYFSRTRFIPCFALSTLNSLIFNMMLKFYFSGQPNTADNVPLMSHVHNSQKKNRGGMKFACN